jgi:hypothetical protein
MCRPARPGATAGFESSFLASGYSFRRPPELEGDRGALNRAALTPMTHKVEGTGRIDVNVNAPPGTRVAAKSGGLFNPVSMTRQTMMHHTQGGPHHTSDFEFGNA